jgi:hypothetical protein
MLSQAIIHRLKLEVIDLIYDCDNHVRKRILKTQVGSRDQSQAGDAELTWQGGHVIKNGGLCNKSRGAGY